MRLTTHRLREGGFAKTRATHPCGGEHPDLRPVVACDALGPMVSMLEIAHARAAVLNIYGPIVQAMPGPRPLLVGSSPGVLCSASNMCSHDYPLVQRNCGMTL